MFKSIVAFASIAGALASVNVPRATSFDLSGTYTDFNAIYKALLSTKKTSAKGLKADVEPAVPEGYTAVFGPVAGANSAPFYMGFVELATYDVQACADACNAADPDVKGGYCQYFNLWQAVINGTASQNVCAKYYVPTNATTADNAGDSNITVSLSRGYARQSVLPDGTFEGFSCPVPTPQGVFGCDTESFGGWVGTSDPGGCLDAVINFYYIALEPLIGNSWAQVGASVNNTFEGTLAPAAPAVTKPGATYVLGFHHRSFDTPQPDFPDNVPTVDIIWNGVTIDTLAGFFNDPDSTLTSYIWKGYTLVATGNDTLAFHGGVYPNIVELDNIFLFLR